MSSRQRVASEERLIRQIKQIMRAQTSSAIEIPIGDDAAAFRPQPGHQILVSTDALVETIHFDLRYFLPRELGWKALAVNLSDIAAMGGKPLYFTTSIAVPERLPENFVVELYRGMARLARQYGVVLIGGDTCSSPHDLFIDVTILGAVPRGRRVTRGEAKTGDLIFVTGELGGSAIGLHLLKIFGRESTLPSALVRRHVCPEPRCHIGRHLAERRLASSMIDVSDGLSTDLNHLCTQSGVGAEIWEPALPIVRLSNKQRRLLSRDPLALCLHGGEDYELLFTTPARIRSKIPEALFGVAIHHIGVITSDRKVWLRDGSVRTRLMPGGFDHFSRTDSHRS